MERNLVKSRLGLLGHVVRRWVSFSSHIALVAFFVCRVTEVESKIL